MASNFDAILELHRESFSKEHAESAVWAALYHLANRLDELTSKSEYKYNLRNDDTEVL